MERASPAGAGGTAVSELRIVVRRWGRPIERLERFDRIGLERSIGLGLLARLAHFALLDRAGLSLLFLLTLEEGRSLVPCQVRLLSRAPRW
jgi:hypothetical protein